MNLARLTMMTFLVLSVGYMVAANVEAGRNYERRLEEYGAAIRWSDFDAANAFVKRNGKDNAWAKAADQYRDIRIADYVVKDSTHQKDSKTVLQTVEILYYRVNNPTIRNLIDRQRWEYDAGEKEWYLMTGLPVFE